MISLNCCVMFSGVSCAQQILGGPGACSVNVKQDGKYFEPNHDMQLSFKKIETICANNQSRKIMTKNQVI
jgi:hypothetical protein